MTKDFTSKKKLFIIGDAGCDTGFAQVSHAFIDNLWTRYDIHVLAINYYGDPHPIQQKAKLYNPAAKVYNDYYGLNRVKPLIRTLKPDIIFLINDSWVAANYADLLEEFTEIPKILYTPVDAPHLKKEYVSELWRFDHVVGYTQFAVDELKKSGLEVPMSHLPHGVNTKLYRPIDRSIARKKNGFLDDWFIINVTDRNSPRKRIDLALYAFSKWVHDTDKPLDVKLHYHGALHDEGWDIDDLIDELDIRNRFIITAPNITAAEGLPLELMPWVYAPADMGISLGHEGWGLCTMERMATKIPMAVSKYSALAEWANGGVHYMDVSTTPSYTTKGLNSRSAWPTVETIVDTFELFYTNKEYRDKIAQAGYDLVTQKKYQWRVIADQFDILFRTEMKRLKELNKDGHTEKTS